MWFSVVCTLIDNESRHHSGQNAVDSRGAAESMSPQRILTTVMTRIVVDKSTDNAKPHLICFLPRYLTSKKMSFFRAGAEKGIG